MTFRRFDHHPLSVQRCPECEDFEMHSVMVGDTGGTIGYFCDPCELFVPSGSWFDIGDPKSLIPEHLKDV